MKYCLHCGLELSEGCETCHGDGPWEERWPVPGEEHYREISAELKLAKLKSTWGWIDSIDTLLRMLSTGRYYVAKFSHGYGLTPHDGGGLFTLIDPETLEKAQEEGYIRPFSSSPITDAGFHRRGIRACPAIKGNK